MVCFSFFTFNTYSCLLAHFGIFKSFTGKQLIFSIHFSGLIKYQPQCMLIVKQLRIFFTQKNIIIMIIIVGKVSCHLKEIN